MIDSEGFRPNVGIILANEFGQVLWAKRIGHNAGNFHKEVSNMEKPLEQALYRELREEVGLLPEHVQIVAQTKGWLRYRLPHRYFVRYRFRSRMYWSKTEVVFTRTSLAPGSDDSV